MEKLNQLFVVFVFLKTKNRNKEQYVVATKIHSNK